MDQDFGPRGAKREVGSRRAGRPSIASQANRPLRSVEIGERERAFRGEIFWHAILVGTLQYIPTQVLLVPVVL